MVTVDASSRLAIELFLKDLATKDLKRFGNVVAGTTGKATRRFGVLRTAIKGTVGSLAGLTVGFLSVAAAIQAFRSGTRTFLNFSEAIGEINTILDTTQFSLADVEREVLDLSLALGEQETLIAKGFYQTLSAGVTDASDALIVLNQSAKLGIAGLASTESAVDVVTSIMNAYGLAVADAADITDTLFKTVELGKTRIPELAADLGAILPVAAELGVDLQQVSAAIAAMTKQGASTSEAVTRLNSIFTALQKKADEVNEAFESLGESFDRDTLRTEGLTAVLLNLRKAFEGNENALVKLIGRKEGVTGLFALTKDGAEVLNETLTELENRLGATDAAFEKQLLTPAREFKILVGGIRQGLLGMGRELVTGLTDGAKSFGTIQDAAKDLRENIEALAPAMRVFLGLVVAGGTAFTGMATAALIAGRALRIIGDSDELRRQIDDLGDATVVAAELARNLITGSDDFTATSIINRKKRRALLLQEQAELKEVAALLEKVAVVFTRREGIGLETPIASTERMQTEVDDLRERMEALGISFDDSFRLGGQTFEGLQSSLRDLGIEVDRISTLPPLIIVPEEEKKKLEETISLLDAFKKRSGELGRELTSESLGIGAAEEAFGELSFGIDQFSRDVARGEASFEKFKDSLLQGLSAILLKTLALKLIGGLFAQGGTVDAPLVGTKSFAFGGIMPGRMGRSLPIHAYQGGGIATSPQLAVFGEGRGAEAFVPLGPNRKIPVEVKGDGAQGGMQVSISLSVQSLDPKGAADVILAQMPVIEKQLAASLQGNRTAALVRAVRGVARSGR